MKDDELPEWTAFADWPLEQVATVAPASIVYAAAGTRRAAALAGLSAESDEYAQWSRGRMIDACGLIFAHGVKHIFTMLAAPGQFAEVGAYRRKLLDWIEWGVAGPEALDDYRRRGWRAQLLCADPPPSMQATQRRLATANQAAEPHAPTLWYMIAPDEEAAWCAILAAVTQTGARTRAEAIRALYGEDVPLISLYLAFGKPTITPDLLPPLLMGKVHCYWTQRPGYELSATELRQILYDYAYLRSTWRSDKTGRADSAGQWRTAWAHGPVLGLGARLGPFWYPQPFEWPCPLQEEAKTELGAYAAT